MRISGEIDVNIDVGDIPFTRTDGSIWEQARGDAVRYTKQTDTD